MSSVPHDDGLSDRQRAALDRVRARTNAARKAIESRQRRPKQHPTPEPTPAIEYHAGGLCTLCATNCGTCARLKKRTWQYRVAGGAWQRDEIDITDDDARAVLGCSLRELQAHIRAGRLVVNGNTRFRISWQSVVALKRNLAVKSVDRAEILRGIADLVGVLASRRPEAHAIIDDWLREASLLPVDSGIVYGRRVNQAAPPRTGWYVYHLCRPNGQTFYVGKGRGRRMYQHADEARKGKNSHKCNTIRRIWSKGQQVTYRVVFVSPSEVEAFAVERAEIARIGLLNLTNLEPGGLSPVEVGRILGVDIPIEYLDARRFLEWVRWRNGWRGVSDELLRENLVGWAHVRTAFLRELRRLAYDAYRDDAVTLIDAECERLSYYTAHQWELFDGLEKYHVKRQQAHHCYVDEWDGWHASRAALSPKPKRRVHVADQLHLDD